MNASTEQFSKLLVLADQCTGRLSALPVRNLKSTSIIRMLQLYLCCNLHPRQVSVDMGTEFSVNLDRFLQPLNIRLTSDGTGVKSTTFVAEMSIRLLKTCLRQASLHNPRLWPQYLPQCLQIINSLLYCMTQKFLTIFSSLIRTSTRIWSMLK